MPVNPTHVPSEELLTKERECLELRRAGLTFDAIAERLGYADRAAAHKAFQRALKRTLQQPAAEVRELEVDRLDRLQVAVWQRALRGDMGAVDRVLRLMERRARLLGLDHADGLAERQMVLAEREAAVLVGVIQRVLLQLDLTEDQQAVAPVIVAQELRAVAELEPVPELEAGGAA